MIKIIGCLLILGASTIAGFIFSESFKKRLKQLNEIERAIGQLENEIEYTYTPLPEALDNVAQISELPISNVFSRASKLLYANNVETVYEAFDICFKEVTVDLNSDDINVVLDLSKSLGNSDIEGHKKIFSLARDNLKKRIALAEEAMSKNVKMYRYLGFSIGAVIVIVLV